MNRSEMPPNAVEANSGRRGACVGRGPDADVQRSSRVREGVAALGAVRRWRTRLRSGAGLVWCALALAAAGCITIDTDVPTSRCPRGEPLEVSDALPVPCRERVETQLAEQTAYDGFVAIRGETVLMRWGDTELPTNIASVRKSIVSLLYGMAAERGLIDLDATLEEIGVGDMHAPLTAAERQATIRDLLQSRSGIFVEPLGEADSWAALRPQRGEYAPGEFWFYNNWDFNALGTIFTHVTGLTLEQALVEWLAEPLQMQTFCTSHVTYESADFTEHDMYRFYMSASDLARIGALVAQGGMWQGEQIVSQAWIEESTRPVSDVQSLRSDSYYTDYGYLWWVDAQGHVWADGSGGQLIHIDPQTRLVTVARNQTGISIPGRIWYSMAQEDDTRHGPETERTLHQQIAECLP